MKRKIVKIIFILLLVLSFAINFTYATDIDLDLPGTIDIDDSSTADENAVIDDSESADDIPADDLDSDLLGNDIYGEDVETLNPGQVTTSSSSELSVTDIINIFLITIGVILVFLAIAILVRLKG